MSSHPHDSNDEELNASSTLHTVLCEVNRSHAGHPWALVDAHLRQRFSESGLTPHEPGFSKFVELIARAKCRL
jgi:hypothetical protein